MAPPQSCTASRACHAQLHAWCSTQKLNVREAGQHVAPMGTRGVQRAAASWRSTSPCTCSKSVARSS